MYSGSFCAPRLAPIPAAPSWRPSAASPGGSITSSQEAPDEGPAARARSHRRDRSAPIAASIASASTVARSFFTPARWPRPSATASAAGSPIVSADPRQHRLRHEMRQPHAELAFLLAVGNARTSHSATSRPSTPVADEFQPLVRAGAAPPPWPVPRRGPMGQRLAHRVGREKLMAEQPLGRRQPGLGGDVAGVGGFAAGASSGPVLQARSINESR